MTTLIHEADRDLALGSEMGEARRRVKRDGAEFCLCFGRRLWVALWGHWAFDPGSWRSIRGECRVTRYLGYGGGIFVHVELFPFWLSFRLGIV